MLSFTQVVQVNDYNEHAGDSKCVMLYPFIRKFESPHYNTSLSKQYLLNMVLSVDYVISEVIESNMYLSLQQRWSCFFIILCCVKEF